LALLTALALVISACGDDGSDGEAADDRADTGTEETTRSDEIDSGGEAAAEGDTAGAGGGTVEVLRLAGGDNGYPSPFAWVRGPGWIHAGYIFDTLAWQDSTGEYIPWLASEWSASDDGTEWRFTLRDNATWHDGEPVTADDVVFTYEYVTEGAGAGQAGFAAGGLRQVASVVAESDTEVVFTLNAPSAAFLEDVAGSVLIIPEHIWAEIENPSEERGPEATMGSGPYKLETADPANGSYLYVANEDFYLGSPVVKRLEFVPINDELLGVQSGELSAGEIGTEQPIPAEQMDTFEAIENLDMIQSAGDWNLALHFNLDAGFPYDDVRFRQALAHGIDRADLVDRILFGRGEPASLGGLAPTHAFGASDLPDYAHDTDRAEALLDEIGLVDADGDGVRDLPDGGSFTPTLKASQRFSADTPQVIKEYLSAIGIAVEVEILDRATADEAGVNGDYTIQLHGYGGIAGDPDTLRQRFTDQANSTSFNKAWGFQDDRFDELAVDQLAALDPDARGELLDEMQAILAEQVPVLPIYVPDRVLFYDTGTFGNWYYTPGCSPCRGSRNKHMFVTGETTGL
jgi:peptide/nickel transport system substrate-binding protein